MGRILDRMEREKRNTSILARMETRPRRRRGGRTGCWSTTDDPEVGYTECAMRTGHRGLHRSEDGVTWDEEHSVY